MIVLELLQVVLGTIGTVGFIENYKYRRKIAELETSHNKLYEMYTGVVEELDTSRKLLPPKDSDGKTLKPIFPEKNLNPVNIHKCNFCGTSYANSQRKLKFNFCSNCENATHRFNYGHMHIICDTCGAAYIQKRAK